VEVLAADGDPLEPGGEICRLDGAIRSILAGERVALNFLQRLSGVATHTDRLVRLLEGTRVRILDTRKTTPLLRMLEKKAVLAGGGANHRFGLFDMILIKDTHVKAAGGPGAAVRKARHYRRDRRKDIPIEVEVQSVDEFKEAMAAGPDRVMLDNMSCDQMRQCVNLAGNYDGSVELEASGNITAETVRDVAETGVDFISVGSLTHSVCAIDIHLVIL
jgi:nicotinate-nucleotide pyrophosphorylase (carboxylating)